MVMRRLVAELVGTAFLLAAVVGSGIMGERLAGGKVTMKSRDIVYATFIVTLVFLPVLTMSEVQGRLFAPLATAYRQQYGTADGLVKRAILPACPRTSRTARKPPGCRPSRKRTAPSISGPSSSKLTSWASRIAEIRNYARENLLFPPAPSLALRDLAEFEQGQPPRSWLKKSQRKPALYPPFAGQA